MTPSLSIVAASDPVPTPETIAERVRRLQADAKASAKEHVIALRASMLETHAVASEIAAGGDSYSVGARELARRVAAQLEADAATLAVIIGRSK